MCARLSVHSAELWTSTGCLFLPLATAIGLWSVTSCVARNYKYTHFPPREQKRPAVMGLPTRRHEQAWARCVGYRVWATSVGGVRSWKTRPSFMVKLVLPCASPAWGIMSGFHIAAKPVKRLFQPIAHSLTLHA